MQALSSITSRGTYLIMSITAQPTLSRHLAEMGLLVGKKITVIQPSSGATGMLVFFQGQRLAMSQAIAAVITVSPLKKPDAKNLMPLTDLKIGQSALVGKLHADKALRKRLMDMGLTSGTMVTLRRVAPLGDPLELTVRGYQLSLRKDEAQQILVEEVAIDG